MKGYVFLCVLLTLLLAAALFIMISTWEAVHMPALAALGIVVVVAAIVIANELRRPMPREYFRKKALFLLGKLVYFYHLY